MARPPPQSMNLHFSFILHRIEMFLKIAGKPVLIEGKFIFANLISYQCRHFFFFLSIF